MSMHPIMIDVEASGFGRGSYPIEVGVALGDGGLRCLIIRPDADWQHWSDEAQALHGIRRETLLKHGRDITEAATQLNQWLAGEKVYSDAWGNDSSWLALLFEYAGIPQRFKVESLRGLLTEPQVEHWHEEKERLQRSCDFRRHRASNDARLLQLTYRHTQKITEHQAVG